MSPMNSSLNTFIKSDVYIYHDETYLAGNVNLCGHVLFFVPLQTKIIFNGRLFDRHEIIISPWNSLKKKYIDLRNTPYSNHKFHFTDISGRRWSKRNEAERNFIFIGIDSLKQTSCSSPSYCKLGIIFFKKPTPLNTSCYGGDTKKEKKLRYEETLLRMLLKGSVHRLYDNFHKANILNIFTDGQPSHRKLSDSRIIERLLEEKRDYISINKDAKIIPKSKNYRKYAKHSDDYCHSNLLQLTDMLLGSSIKCCFSNIENNKYSLRIGDKIRDKKGYLAFPLKEILEKRKRGKNFVYSKHYNSFSISKALIENNIWNFHETYSKDKEFLCDNTQTCLFDDFFIQNNLNIGKEL